MQAVAATRRILVVNDVDLWITLNQHFSGSRSVEVNEADGWEQALTLAEIERPEFVVCRIGENEAEARGLAEDFGRRAIPGARLLCVVSDEGADPAPAPWPNVALCPARALAETIARAIDLESARGLGPRVELLGTIERVDGEPSDAGPLHVNLLELSESELLLEGGADLEIGQSIDLAFFVPGEAAGVRHRITASCVVLRAHDQGKQVYVSEIRKIGPGDKEKLCALLDRLRREEARVA